MENVMNVALYYIFGNCIMTICTSVIYINYLIQLMKKDDVLILISEYRLQINCLSSIFGHS